MAFNLAHLDDQPTSGQETPNAAAVKRERTSLQNTAAAILKELDRLEHRTEAEGTAQGMTQPRA